MYFTSKLNWKMHIDYLLTKGRQRLNFLKIINFQAWSQDTKTLLHLATTLVRAKIIYGQEVYHSAPKYLLNKLQSLDSKAIKLAIGVPVHSNTSKTYQLAGILSLESQRLLAAAKYVVRSLSVDNSNFEEVNFDACHHYSHRAQKIKSLVPLRNFTQNVFSHCNVNIDNIKQTCITSTIPPWEHLKANVNMDYTSLKKGEDINMVTSAAKEQLSDKYNNYLKVFTDGSVLDSGDVGAGFVIPFLNIKKGFYLGRGFSIFSAELYALLMALNFILDFGKDLFGVVFCIDSKCILYAITNWKSKIRSDMIFEIRFLIHCLKMKNIIVELLWVPSHVGISGNELADQTAKEAAMNNVVTNNYLVHSSSEIYSFFYKMFFKNIHKPIFSSSRIVNSLFLKLKLSSWRTKYVPSVFCHCSGALSLDHLFFECPILIPMYTSSGINSDLRSSSVQVILENDKLLFGVALCIYKSPLINLL